MKIRDKISDLVPAHFSIGEWGELQSAAILGLGRAANVDIYSPLTVELDDARDESYPTSTIEISISIAGVSEIGASLGIRSHFADDLKIFMDYFPIGEAEFAINAGGAGEDYADSVSRGSVEDDRVAIFGNDLFLLLTGNAGFIVYENNAGQLYHRTALWRGETLYVESGRSRLNILRRVPASLRPVNEVQVSYFFFDREGSGATTCLRKMVDAERVQMMGAKHWNLTANTLARVLDSSADDSY